MLKIQFKMANKKIFMNNLKIMFLGRSKSLFFSLNTNKTCDKRNFCRKILHKQYYTVAV